MHRNSIPTQMKHKRRSIQRSDPGKIMDLVISLGDETSAELEAKVNKYLAEECEAELVFQIIINKDRVEAWIEAVGSTVLPRKQKICMFDKMNETIKSSIEQTENLFNFPCDVLDIVTPFLELKDHSKPKVVMYPIAGKPFSSLVCVVAPTVLEDDVTAYIHECFLFVWQTLQKTIAYEYECTLKEKCQQLLRVARRLFTEVTSLDTLLKITMDQAKLLLKAEHCKLMLVDLEKMELVDSVLFKIDVNSDTEQSDRRFSLNKGIAGQVIQTGAVINAKVAKDHPAYDPSIDGYPSVTCKTIMCFPIRDQTGIVGVGQLINKISEPYFDGMDEELALAFSVYCGVCIVHSVLYQKMQEAHIRSSLANELVMYHMKVSDEDVTRVLDCKGFHEHPHLSSVHFNTGALPLRELPCYVIKMFNDLGFDKKFRIRPQKLACFVLYVRRGYRDVPYHNWQHAFNTAQWAYAAMVTYKLLQDGYLTDLQGLMYLVAALVHDIDHRGTTNSFHVQGKTSLAALYSSEGSVMERHHIAQAVCLLNTEGCDILQSLPRHDYDRAIMLLRDYILATDLANYFKNLNEYKTIAMDFQKENRVHNTTLRALLMNGADLSDQLKDWSGVKKTAAAVLSEFFKQGELEKARGDLPSSAMDRDTCFIPQLQLHFISHTCAPLYQLLGQMLPAAASCVKVLEDHVVRWEAAKPIFAEVPISEGLSILLSPELDSLIEFQLREKERLRVEAEQAARAAREAAAAAEAKANEDSD